MYTTLHPHSHEDGDARTRNSFFAHFVEFGCLIISILEKHFYDQPIKEKRNSIYIFL